MKLTKGKKIALTCFAIFLGLMAVCTVVAKGIYASGLPRVSAAKLSGGSLTHVIRLNGTVQQGQEYGVYVEPGLRVDTCCVGKGDSFRKGDPLLRISPEDLSDIIAQRELEISKLEVQLSEAVKEDSQDRKARQQEAKRAREDYDREAVLADAQIQKCQQDYEAAQRALVLYNQYLENASRLEEDEVSPSGNPEGDASQPEGSGTSPAPSGDGGEESAPSGASTAPDAGEAGEGLADPGSEEGREESGTEGSSPESGVEESKPEGAVPESGVEESRPEGAAPESGVEESKPEGAAPESGVEEPKPEGAAPESGVEESKPEGAAPESGVEESRPEGAAPEDSTGKSEAGSDPEGSTEEAEWSRSGGEDVGQSGEGKLHEAASVAPDPEDQYNKEEKRRQLEQNIIAAAQALAEAERQKEDRLKTAARAVEDADAAVDGANAAVNTLALDIAYQKERLQGLEELLAAEGWVYAEAPGRITDSRLEVGARIQDGACLLYALDDGRRIINAVLEETQAGRISPGTQFDMKASMPDGSRSTGTAVADYVEEGADGRFYARFSFEQLELAIGQSVELSYRIQTENYAACVPAASVYKEESGAAYVYLVEERQGILGKEWMVRKVYVRILDQNDTAAAIESMELMAESRIVTNTSKPLSDGDVVRVVQ